MPRTSPSLIARLRAAASLLTLLLLPLVLPAAAAAQDAPPTLANWTLDPPTVPYTGGAVEIGVDAADDVGVARVDAELLCDDGSSMSAELLPGGGDRYVASVEMPPNFTDFMRSYSVIVQATDTDGAAFAEYAGEIVVEPQPTYDDWLLG